MMQIGGDFNLAEEPLGTNDDGEFGPEHLDRHFAVVLQVLGEVDGRHAAAPDLSLDGVAVGKGGLETVEDVCHGALCPLGYLPTIR